MMERTLSAADQTTDRAPASDQSGIGTERPAAILVMNAHHHWQRASPPAGNKFLGQRE
jgi:hypothetical protein